jgi:hypothetical protein
LYHIGKFFLLSHFFSLNIGKNEQSQTIIYIGEFAKQNYCFIMEVMEEMTSKEFDLMIDLMLELLKDGKTEKVIELLEKAKESNQ